MIERQELPRFAAKADISFVFNHILALFRAEKW